MSSTIMMIPLSPREQLCNRYCSNKHTHRFDRLSEPTDIMDIFSQTMRAAAKEQFGQAARGANLVVVGGGGGELVAEAESR
jgi:hypothetical protein